MELRVLNYFFNGSKRRKYHKSGTVASCYSANAFQTAHAVRGRTGSAAFS